MRKCPTEGAIACSFPILMLTNNIAGSRSYDSVLCNNAVNTMVLYLSFLACLKFLSTL